MDFFTAVGICLRKYFTLSGRASRAEYWWWTLFVFVGSFLYTFAASFTLPELSTLDPETLGIGELGVMTVLGLGFSLFTIIPTYTVTVRRLHDTERSGIWVLVPWIINGLIIWGALMAMPPQLRAAGLTGVGGDPLFGSILMFGAGLAQLIISIKLLIWMIKPGTRGDNFFGPDPRGQLKSYGEEFVSSRVPQVGRGAETTGQRQMGHREEVAAFYQQKVLGKQQR